MNERPATRPNPNEKLVRIFDTEQESEALVVHGLLQSTGIDSDVTSLDAQQDILPGVGGTIILVREEVLARRGKAHVLPYRTDLEGAVTFYLDRKTVTPGLPPAEVH